MTILELAKELDIFYKIGQERKECNALIQCFGIKYADYINNHKIKLEDILEKSCLKGTSYSTEIRKGIKLSKYVYLRENM